MKSTEDENKEGATASLAAANGISIDDAVASVLSQLDGILTVREEQKRRWRLWLVEKIFLLYSTGFGTIGSPELLLTGSPGCKKKKSDWSAFKVCPSLLVSVFFPKCCYELLHTLIPRAKLMDLGNIPFGVPGWIYGGISREQGENSVSMIWRKSRDSFDVLVGYN